MYSYLQLDGFIKENNQRNWQRNKTSKQFRPKKVVVLIKYIYRIFFLKDKNLGMVFMAIEKLFIGSAIALRNLQM